MRHSRPYRRRYLWFLSFWTLVAAAEVLVAGEDESLSAQDVAENVDRYLADLQSRGKTRIQLALVGLCLWPLFSFRPPLPWMAPASRRRYLERRFLTDVAERRTWHLVRPYVQAMIRVASQFTYLGYYGDRRSWPEVGYTPFRDRPDGRPPEPGDNPDPPLRVLENLPGPHDRHDTIVIGSGAAGSILAYRCAEAGRRVLVLERGPFVDPRSFVDDEVAQYLLLYNEGAMQLAADFRLQILQGMCVGGGTTVNNALCFRPPAAILERWARHGVDGPALERAIDVVSEWLHVQPIPATAASDVSRRFAGAAAGLSLPGRIEVMSANISDRCLGCGYCNIGCAYGAKLSMLDTVLPWGQQRYGDRLQILPAFEVTAIVTEDDRAVGVRGRHRRGAEVTLRAAESVVLSAGAVHSSCILQGSRIGGDRPGHGLFFNVTSPLTAEFEEEVDAFDGIQMSHAYHPPGGIPAFLLETWFNPPATQALAMPGWFGQHFHNMRRYRHMASGAALVGTTSAARVTDTRGGPKIAYQPSRTDLGQVVEGLKLVGRIFLAAGAKRVMPATYAWHAFSTPAELDALDRYVADNSDLLLSTSHPQGGNAMGDPGTGVVDDGFRLHGFSNLFVCDASVFPSSAHVNPQLTVMGLAQYAAERIVSL